MLVTVVPAFNEEKTIGSVVRNLFQSADKVVVVDDGSIDYTGKEAKAAGAVVLTHKINRGQGAALQTGHDYALRIGADYVLHFDGDGQLAVEDIAPALAKLKEAKVDILFGSRFLGSCSQIPWSKRYVILPLARLFQTIFGGIRLTDAHNGFRILNRQALEKIKITQDRMAHASEIPFQVKKNGLKYIEYPVKVVYPTYGQGLGGGIKIIIDLVTGLFLK